MLLQVCPEPAALPLAASRGVAALSPDALSPDSQAHAVAPTQAIKVCGADPFSATLPPA